jgi:lipoate-protein ligase A
MEVFEKLQLWIDPNARSGPEAMAVDEWLLETATRPVLSVYRWLGDWASVGYFGEIAAAQTFIDGVRWVRRWTGGGTVDHRADWTYSVIVPQGESLATLRGAESYRAIHAVLADTLTAEGIDARMSRGSEETGAALCFENPVSHDLIVGDGRKLAGAGQRRSRQGLLHQGSVAAVCDDGLFHTRAAALADRLSRTVEVFPLRPDPQSLADKIAARYGRSEWTNRR